jgi:hypothetical protein
MKLRVGSLRKGLRQGTIAPDAIEAHLAAVEQDIDRAAVLAQDVQGQASSSA